MNETAIIIGATGLVGNHLLQLLLEDKNFSCVKIFVRRKTGIDNPKLKEFIIDFNDIERYSADITGDVLFSCLGTTLKQAGSKEAQYKVDYTYQYKFAELASKNGVQHYLLVSSTGANAKSAFFYSKIKGELEQSIKQMPFDKIVIVQPSVLKGERNENRMGEKIGAAIIDGLSKIIAPLKKYRSIKGAQVAQALVRFYKLQSNEQCSIYRLDELFDGNNSK
jgi:uncharacterized protein YbjT (DUF2867 family)